MKVNSTESLSGRGAVSGGERLPAIIRKLYSLPLNIDINRYK